MTGMHVVADISCKACGAELGWKYVSVCGAVLRVRSFLPSFVSACGRRASLARDHDTAGRQEGSGQALALAAYFRAVRHDFPVAAGAVVALTAAPEALTAVPSDLLLCTGCCPHSGQPERRYPSETRAECR